jgi:two-component system sensor histidine kinase CpxA
MVRSLFAKILLWSVTAQLLTVGTILYLVTFYLPESQEAVDNAFKLYAETAVTLYERFGPEALDKFLARSGESTLLRLKLSTSTPDTDCIPSNDEVTGILAQGQTGSYCLTITAKSWDLPASPDTRRMRLLITVILELLCCAGLSYTIARYLSRPISELRRTATRLAKGDLSARVGSRFARRKDEAADLVREFDQMAERVVSLIEAQRRLISDVSHEIKSPLARLTMALNLARRDAEQHAPKQFTRMQNEIDSISHLVGELLTLASLNAATGRPLNEPFDLAEAMGEVVTDIAFESPQRAADLAYSRPDAAMLVRGDRKLLARAINNVVRNAVFYTPPGAAIDMTCSVTPEGRVHVSIVDQGPGVPEAALPHLFEPFYRVDDARNRQTGGTGIGLAICRRAIELHDGMITASNVAPHGLAVVIDLPQA